MIRFFLASIFIVNSILGIGYFSLPVVVSASGFGPGVIAVLGSWILAFLTGFIYLEAVLAFPPGANIWTISKNLLGPFFKWFNVVLFIGGFVSFMITYYLMMNPFFEIFSERLFAVSFPPFVNNLILSLLLGGSVYLGKRFTFWFSLILFGLFLVLFSQTMLLGIPHLNELALTNRHWVFFSFTLPFIYNAFFFQVSIPTIAEFLHYERKKIKGAIFLGTTVACLLILIWLTVTAGTHVSLSIHDIFEQSTNPILSYLQLRNLPVFGFMMPRIIMVSAFTSALTVGLVVMDFFGDAFKIPLDKRKGLNRFWLSILIFLPVMVASFFAGGAFINFFHSIVGIVDIILAPLIPICWVWSARYTFQLNPVRCLGGGKPVLVLLSFISIFLLYIEGVLFIQQIHW